jgi:F0F1-type ATP synthase membrane subunit c/vacuolar-type H+-ATPase subunit K
MRILIGILGIAIVIKVMVLTYRYMVKKHPDTPPTFFVLFAGAVSVVIFGLIIMALVKMGLYPDK